LEISSSLSLLKIVKSGYTVSVAVFKNDPRERYTLRNILGLSTVEFFWGTGLPVIIDSTFLQLFLKNLGASSFAIGCVPALFFLGPALLGPVSGYLTAHLERKRASVLLFHLGAAVVWVIFGLYYLAAGNTDSTVPIFLAFYALFTAAVGLMLPAWQNYIGRVFAPYKAVSSIAVIITSQTVAKIVGSFLILRTVERYSFHPRASAGVFLVIGTIFILGSLFFLLSREVIAGKAAVSVRGRFISHLKRSFSAVFRNRDFLLYLGGNIEFFTVVSVLAFYANYAVEYGGIDPASAAGLFVMVNYTMQLAMNLVFGWKNLLSLKNKCITSHIISLTGVGILISGPGLAGFLAASACLGSSRAMRNLVYIPAIRQMAVIDDATDFFAAAPIITLPVSASLSFLSGKLLDLLAPLGEWSYRLFFCGAAVMILISLLFILRTNFTKNSAY